MNDPNGTIRAIKRPSRRRRDGLIRFASNKTSQSGEDGILQRLFQLLPAESESSSSSSGSDDCTDINTTNTTDRSSCRWAVDVGAWDGIHLSNTNSLLSNSTSGTSTPWRGVLIEADPEKYEKLKSLHEPLDNICLSATVSCQPWSQQSLSNILSSSFPSLLPSTADTKTTTTLPEDFDFLCIDVDGTDYWLLHDIFTNTHYRPKVICIEFNPTIPHNVLFIPPRDDTIRHGCSITALVELASMYNYQLVETTCYNAFFVQNDLYVKYNIRRDIPFEPTIEHLHEVTMGTQLYQLYDGTIKLAGCQKLLWHRKPILEEHVQVLKDVNERNFPFAPSAGAGGKSTHKSNNDSKHTNTNNNTKRRGGKTNNKNGPNTDNIVNGNEEHQKIMNQQLKQEEMMYHHLAVDMSPYCSPLSPLQPSPLSSSSSLQQQSSTSSSAAATLNMKDSITKDTRSKCSHEIYQQLKQDGFALVRGTGIPSNVCNDALQWTNSFLQDAKEAVRRSCLTKDRARRGYSPQNSENFASLVGARGSNDLVRKFRVGPSNTGNSSSSSLSQTMPGSDATSSSPLSSALLQPNSWPTVETWGEDNATEFHDSITTYYNHICQVAHAIVNAICDGIKIHNPDIRLPSSLVGVGESASQTTTCGSGNIQIHHDSNNGKSQETENTSILTLLGYRKGARHQGKHSSPLIAAHTDVGVITVLIFDCGDSAVLQRSQSTNGSNSCEKNTWVDVKLPKVIPEDPVFVVNIGDCLSDMCGAMLPSTLHRVMPSKGGTVTRNCLALFMGLKPDEVLNLPNSDNNDERVTYEEWRRQRIARAQAELMKHKTQPSKIKEGCS